MARKSTPQPLTLSTPQLTNNEGAISYRDTKSPLSPKSPKTPKSPFRFNTSKKVQGEEPLHATESLQSTLSQTSVTLQSLAQLGDGPEKTKAEQRERSTKSGFFANYKAAKSSSRLQQNDQLVRPVDQEDKMSKDTDHLAMSERVSSRKVPRNDSSGDRSLTRRPVGGPTKSDLSLDTVDDSGTPNTSLNATKKNKPKPFSLLQRTKSIHAEQSPVHTSPTDKVVEPPQNTDNRSDSVKTAPLLGQGDRSFRTMMSTVRQHSADRVPRAQRDRSREEKDKIPREAVLNGRTQTSSSLSKEHTRNPTNSGTTTNHTFLSSLKNQATKGAGGLSKALFGKGRSGSTNERAPEVTDEQYKLKVLNLALVEQTRLTRISKKLEDSRDKTEFWMPAFPWRAIDYLNYRGSEEEGLYRIPGSAPQVKMWQRRFDEQLDIDLFQQTDLFDVNIIGSMLKAWLRELPDDILPKDAQERIMVDALHKGTGEDVPVPQILVDELSNLPPFNYYLLFAITCHLSLLLQHKEKNKMDYNNLQICFRPPIRIEAFCFWFLVNKWRDCWKGCKTESFYVEQEYMLFDKVGALHPPSSAEGSSSNAVESGHEERNVSSSEGSKPSSVTISVADNTDRGRQEAGNQSKLNKNGSNGIGLLPLSQPVGNSSTTNTTLTVVDQRERERPKQARSQGDTGGSMRPLSPIKPLSPIGF